MLVCAIAIFELAVIIALLFIAGRYAKIQCNSLWTEFAIISAYLDKNSRDLASLKKDIDVKFGPDLVEKLNAIFKLNEPTNSLMIDKKTGKVVKITPGY